MLLIQILDVGIHEKYHPLKRHIEAEMELNEVVLVQEDEMGILGVIMELGTMGLWCYRWMHGQYQLPSGLIPYRDPPSLLTIGATTIELYIIGNERKSNNPIRKDSLVLLNIFIHLHMELWIRSLLPSLCQHQL